MTSHTDNSLSPPTVADPITSDHPPPPPSRWQPEDTSGTAPRIRLMCSFGGRILPRPHDNQLRYVGGDTRIVAVHRNCTYSLLLSKLSKFTATTDINVKYQLPNEDLDALISVTSDEDVDNMMEEYDRLLSHGTTSGNNNNSRTTTPRLRLFLFPSSDIVGGTFGSILSGTGSSKHDHWFLDALNGGRPLERGRSEASSILSEVPDYLFGLDNNSDVEPIKLKTSTVSVSDPGSPAPIVSSPHYGSTSSVNTAPAPAPTAEMVEPPPPPVWQYVHEPMPVYYMPATNLPVRPVPVPMQYGQVPVGYRPVYVGSGSARPPQGIAGSYRYPTGAEGYEGLAAGVRISSAGVVPMYRPAVMGDQNMAGTGSQ